MWVVVWVVKWVLVWVFGVCVDVDEEAGEVH